MGELEIVMIDPVVRHQKPTGTTLFCGMHPIAGGRLRDLCKQRLGVGAHDLPEERFRRKVLAELARSHPECFSWDLGKCVQGRSRADAEIYRNPRHSLAADGCDLDDLTGRAMGDHREDAIKRKEHPLYRLASVDDPVSNVHATYIEIAEEPLQTSLRKSRKELIAPSPLDPIGIRHGPGPDGFSQRTMLSALPRGRSISPNGRPPKQFLPPTMSRIATLPGALRSALFPRAAFDLVAIAASAGGVSTIKMILAGIAAHFPVPIVVVQHTPPLLPSQLSEVLGWRSRLQTRFAHEDERLCAGRVYVAPPGRHLIVHGAPLRLQLEDSARLNYVRPAADRLLITAAEQLGPRLLCVVLTGMGRDGAAGAAEVKRRGGTVIVQDPATAEAESMPRATLTVTAVDLVLPPSVIPSALSSLCEVIGARELFCGDPAPAVTAPA